MDSNLVTLIYATLGCFSGFAAGLLGVGGGLIIVPVLVGVFAMSGAVIYSPVHVAIGTSLASIMLTSISSAIAHHRHGAVDWGIVKRFAPGIIVGAVLGAILATSTDNEALKKIFAIFEILIALQMWFEVQPPMTGQSPGTILFLITGVVIGTISSLIGIGGGTMTVPFLSWSGITIHRAIATSAACGVPIAIVGTISYFVLGVLVSGNEQSSGYINLPAFFVIALCSLFCAPLGARVSHRLPRAALRKIFSLLLLVLGLFMFTFL